MAPPICRRIGVVAAISSSLLLWLEATGGGGRNLRQTRARTKKSANYKEISFNDGFPIRGPASERDQQIFQIQALKGGKVVVANTSTARRAHIAGIKVKNAKPEHIRSISNFNRGQPGNERNYASAMGALGVAPARPSVLPTPPPATYLGTERVPYRPEPELNGHIAPSKLGYRKKTGKPQISWQHYLMLFPEEKNKTIASWKKYNRDIIDRKLPPPAPMWVLKKKSPLPGEVQQVSAPTVLLPDNFDDGDDTFAASSDGGTTEEKLEKLRRKENEEKEEEEGVMRTRRRGSISKTPKKNTSSKNKKKATTTTTEAASPTKQKQQRNERTYPKQQQQKEGKEEEEENTSKLRSAAAAAQAEPTEGRRRVEEEKKQILIAAPTQMPTNKKKATAPPPTAATPSRSSSSNSRISRKRSNTAKGGEKKGPDESSWARKWLGSFSPPLLEYVDVFRKNYIESPSDLKDITDQDLQTEFQIQNKFHRRKILREMEDALSKLLPHAK